MTDLLNYLSGYCWICDRIHNSECVWHQIMVNTQVIHGDCVEVMASMEWNSVDAIVCDPPYDLTSGGSTGFMGKKWDGTGVAFRPETWIVAYQILKPGGYLLAFGGTRTFHRLTCAIEDAGFEIRDCLSWMYGSGFPKSMDVGKQIDKQSGAKREKIVIPADRIRNPKSINSGHGVEGGDRPWMIKAIEDGQYEKDGNEPVTDAAKEWNGWGTNLKPSWEPIIMARKPIAESTVVDNVLRYGTGAINIDATRIGGNPGYKYNADTNGTTFHGDQGSRIKRTAEKNGGETIESSQGRWPANTVLSHTPDCQQVGQRQVKGYVINRFDDGAKPFGDGAGHAYTSVGDAAPETIDVWDCIPECAVRMLDEQSGIQKSGTAIQRNGGGQHIGGNGIYAGSKGLTRDDVGYSDTGGASRFFYTAKVAVSERQERTKVAGISNIHPTVKPIELMRWLVKLVCRPDGTVLDPFAGSGTTLVAAMMEGMNSIGIEITDEYIPIIKARTDGVQIGGLFG